MSRAFLAVPAVLLASLVLLAPADSRSLAGGCVHWAAPTGDDGGVGSQASPYATVDHLFQSLKPGQTGCLAPGAVFTQHVVVTASGLPGKPITVMSTPNQQGAVLQGGIEFAPGAHDAHLAHVAVRTTSGAGLAGLVVLRGLRNQLLDSNVSGAGSGSGSGACVLLDHANHARIDHDEIDSCSQPGILDSISVSAQITNNVIRYNAGDGISLSPDAQLSTVSNNLIQGNGGGVFFGGNAKSASNDNKVTHNMIASSSGYSVHASYDAGAPVGQRNVVSANCLWKGGQGNVSGLLPGGGGFKTVGNVIAAPADKRCVHNLPAVSGSTSSKPAAPASSKLASPTGIPLSATAAITGNQVKFIALAAHGIVSGSAVDFICVRACKISETVRAILGVAKSQAFVGKTVPEGAVLEVRASKPGYVGVWRDFLVKPDVAAGVVFRSHGSGCLRGSAKVACPPSK